ncbi:hypothetical protein M0638_19705 [Roseomonas sp. NAR14]|uniref:Uncharacterized protein n=1 Tax=Roseomonas acroporae TaxID=2937791 RepID=A0A9X1YCQ7_9PROT|nr:hypothetical protein [Roseomonas acroporae]MCK8786605.1 hypothetical protein [Roseomonas acroporae]
MEVVSRSSRAIASRLARARASCRACGVPSSGSPRLVSFSTCCRAWYSAFTTLSRSAAGT